MDIARLRFGCSPSFSMPEFPNSILATARGIDRFGKMFSFARLSFFRRVTSNREYSRFGGMLLEIRWF